MPDGPAHDELSTAAVPGSNGEIAFTRDRDGTYEIYVMPTGGGDVTNLTNHASGDTTPAWSPDGSKLAFMSWRDGNGGIYVMSADGSDPILLAQHPGA